MSQQSKRLIKPEVYGPPNITATLEPHEHDPRITIITFTNQGNTKAPKTLKRAVLLPAGITLPPVLGMFPDIAVYTVFIDSIVTRIIITLGKQDMGYKTVYMLVAVIDHHSTQEGDHRAVHLCSELD